MKGMDIESLENEPIFIGKIIEEELRSQERTVTWLSRKIHCDRRNIYDIFSRTSIDTDLLYRLSLALHKDFFAYFSTNLQLIDHQSFTPPVTIHTSIQETSLNPSAITTPILSNDNNNFGLAAKATGTLTNIRHANSNNSPTNTP